AVVASNRAVSTWQTKRVETSASSHTPSAAPPAGPPENSGCFRPPSTWTLPPPSPVVGLKNRSSCRPGERRIVEQSEERPKERSVDKFESRPPASRKTGCGSGIAMSSQGTL
ncbi:unnamed protein product, partial [Ectocarpus sp. 12 AP-2014]